MENTKTVRHGSAVVIIHRPQLTAEERTLREEAARQAAARLMRANTKGHEHGKNNN